MVKIVNKEKNKPMKKVEVKNENNLLRFYQKISLKIPFS